jgi:glycosyltransferase involved in cell wall biosynthesis
MKRVAWFTPLPPVRSGIARYSVELLSRLGHLYEIDGFVDATECHVTSGLAGVFSAHDFVWKQAVDPYDLIVYQLGNAPCHDYMWPYLVRFPGLVTLHDGQLHHSRARRLLGENRPAHYRAEFLYNHPGADPCLADLGVAGLLGALVQFWPMRRTVLTASRLVLVHNTKLAEDLREEDAAAAVSVVEMGVSEHPAKGSMRQHVRTSLGLSPDTILFAAFGKVTPEKRIPQALRALATLPLETPWHLVLCGELVDHYDPSADAQALGIADHVTVTGYVDEDDMSGYVEAVDICICLRWPSSRETSASWLRCLAAGKATIVTDLVHLSDVPSLDPRPQKWAVAGYPAGRDALGHVVRAACISIDILDEDHSLGLAVRRIAADGSLRETLGQAARQLWTDRFTLDRMASGYERTMERVCGTQFNGLQRAGLPAHLLRDGTEHTSAILAEFGLDNPQ